MRRNHRTSAIPRPGGATRPRPDAAAAAAASTIASPKADRSKPRRRSDLTQPIAMERQLVTRRGNRGLLALLALGVIGALAAALFVLPVQAWLHQEDDLDAKQSELDVLQRANNDLQVETDRLQTPEGAKEAARDELGVVDEGEQRISVLPSGEAPITLPSGWPYDTVTKIIAARAAIVAATPATPAPAMTLVP